MSAIRITTLPTLNVVVTPHLGWYTDGAVERILKIALENIAAFMRGEIINRLA